MLVSCNGVYEDFYNFTSSSCGTLAYPPLTTTTTIPAEAEATADYIDAFAVWVGTAIGGGLDGGKLIIWSLVSIGICIIPLAKKWTKDFLVSGFILLIMFLMGVFIGWIPLWIGITFMVIASAIIASKITGLLSGG
jgi:hypothetical protein